MKKSNYDKYPATKVSGTIIEGWNDILKTLQPLLIEHKTLVVDTYVGVHIREVKQELAKLNPDLFIDIKEVYKSEREILEMTRRFITDDSLFGYVTNIQLADYLDEEKIKEAEKKIQNNKGTTIIIGCGASLIAPKNAIILYADMARWEIQQRFRRNEVSALGVDNSDEPVSLQYKRGYFNDWRICDKHKDSLFDKVSFWIDTHITGSPKMIDKATFWEGINQTINSPFRVVPFFDPAPWGGQWMKKVCGLDEDKINYGWCFDCVPEENSLLLDVNGTIFEMPSVNLVLLKSRELLGEPVEARFGKEFPIRFDLLDTVKGGNLSLQVHPTTQFIRENFGMFYTQDESYYMLAAEPDAVVYLGLRKDADKEEMKKELYEAQSEGKKFEADKYIHTIPAKKHDHFLIPGGTIHCSGAEGVVLEISSTPNIFTFKMWDWERLGLDGKPRPINLDRAMQVIDWNRNAEYVEKNLANVCTIIDKGEGWTEEKTGLHPNEFIETRRHTFKTKVIHHTNNSVNVLNLVQGKEAIVESPTNQFEPFVVHYAETFIIPAAIGEYTITPVDNTEDEEYMTIKAFVRF